MEMETRGGGECLKEKKRKESLWFGDIQGFVRHQQKAISILDHGCGGMTHDSVALPCLASPNNLRSDVTWF